MRSALNNKYLNLWYQWQVTNQSLQIRLVRKLNEIGKLNKTYIITIQKNTNVVKINNYLLILNKTLILHIILILYREYSVKKRFTRVTYWSYIIQPYYLHYSTMTCHYIYKHGLFIYTNVYIPKLVQTGKRWRLVRLIFLHIF